MYMPLSIYLSFCLSIYVLFICLSICCFLSICLSMCVSICFFFYLSVYLSVCLSMYFSIYQICLRCCSFLLCATCHFFSIFPLFPAYLIPIHVCILLTNYLFDLSAQNRLDMCLYAHDSLSNGFPSTRPTIS